MSTTKKTGLSVLLAFIGMVLVNIIAISLGYNDPKLAAGIGVAIGFIAYNILPPSKEELIEKEEILKKEAKNILSKDEKIRLNILIEKSKTEEGLTEEEVNEMFNLSE